MSFFICHILRLFLNIEELLTYEDRTQTYEKAETLGLYCRGVQFWTMVAADVSLLLLQVNASINFFIYCYVSNTYKKTLKGILIKLVRVCRCTIFNEQVKKTRKRQGVQVFIELQDVS